MIDGEGQLWAIGFGHTCFLPLSFVSFSLRLSSNIFVKCIARHLNNPSSENFEAMVAASGRLVIFGDNTVGK